MLIGVESGVGGGVSKLVNFVPINCSATLVFVDCSGTFFTTLETCDD